MDDFKVGDWVKGSNKKGESVEFVVTQVLNHAICNDWGYFSLDDSEWSFEKVTPPLPTEPGLYQFVHVGSSSDTVTTYRLDESGYWWQLSASARVSTEDMELAVAHMGNNRLVSLVRRA